ncbi:MAG: hypothetical protein FWH29_09235 [Methanobrevibacter sp.]|nr:hypothetical protein [Methanobrevibacter sp.]
MADPIAITPTLHWKDANKFTKKMFKPSSEKNLLILERDVFLDMTNL